MERHSVRDAADILGITTGAVRSRLSRGTLQSVKEGGMVYVLLPPDAQRDAAREATDMPAEATDMPAEATDMPAEATDMPAESSRTPTALRADVEPYRLGRHSDAES
jgi:hypothetical protein